MENYNGNLYAFNLNFNNGNSNRNNLNNNNNAVAVSAFSEGFTLQELYNAYFNCRKNKRWKYDSLEFELNYKYNIEKLLDEINSYSYEIGQSICFLVWEPKPREVFAANFRDRVVHHLIINELSPLFENYFIDNSFSCRKGKGVLAAQVTLFNTIREITNNYTLNDFYFCKNDCKAFFNSIDKNILWNELKMFIMNNYNIQRKKNLLLWLALKIIYNCPKHNCIKLFSEYDLNKIPKDKSLFFTDDDKGLPIGNITSQWFGNFYLTDFDKYAISQSKFYIRYADDSVGILNSSSECRNYYRNLRNYLWNTRNLILNSDKIYIQHYSKGIRFLGISIKNGRVHALNKIINKLFNSISKNKINSINSYLGLISHYYSYKIINKLNLKQYKI